VSVIETDTETESGTGTEAPSRTNDTGMSTWVENETTAGKMKRREQKSNYPLSVVPRVHRWTLLPVRHRDRA
jgi:hypothetical protein